MTPPEFWQAAYLAALARAPFSPDRAKAAADRAVADQPACTGAGAVPVYRLRNGGQYLYTIDPTERDRAVSTYGYVLEGVAFYAWVAP